MAADLQPSDPALAQAAGGRALPLESRSGGESVLPGVHEVPAPLADDPEASWMVAFCGGDEEAFERIVKTYQPRILRFLERRLRDSGRAEDLTQEVFLRVYRARRGYLPKAKLGTWLFTIANRLSLNELRGVRRRRRVFVDSFPIVREREGAETLTAEDVVAAKGPPPSAKAELRELEEAIGGLIERLPVHQRTAIELLARDRLSYSEIAGVMDVSVAAVRSLIVRARQSLRSWLSPYAPAPRDLATNSGTEPCGLEVRP